MSATGKRNADRLNIIGVVVVGICGAVLTYVSIVLLEAFYMNETSAIERQQAFEAQGSLRNTVKSAGLTHLDGTTEGTLAIERAMEIVAVEATKDPSNLVPAVGASKQPSVEAEYGRPKTLGAPTPAPTDAAAPAGAAPAGAAPATGDAAATPPAPGTTPDVTAPTKTTPADGTKPAAPSNATGDQTATPSTGATAPATTPAKPAATKPAPAKPATGAGGK
jgi:hypothetical protein